MAKKDDGRIPELGITEEMRDQLAKRDWTKPAKDPKDNPNNWTTKECEEKRFSGFRLNELSGTFELWMVGRIVATRRELDVANNPALMADMIEEGCATNGSFVTTDAQMKMLPSGTKGVKH